MPTWILPSDANIPGNTGHTTDHNHIVDDLTILRNSQTDWLNVVTEYSADPTGTADSTAAITAALNAAVSGQVVYLPEGTYKTTSPLTIPQGITLLGAAGGFGIPIGNYGIGGLPVNGAVIQPSSSFSGSAVISMSSGASQSGQQQLRQFSIDCSNLTGTPTVHGIQAANGVAGVKMRDVLAYGGNGKTAGHGLYLLAGANTNPDFWDIAHCKFSGFGGNGVTMSGVADTYVMACEATGNTGWGWALTNGNNTRFVACKAEGAGTNGGWQLTAAGGFTGQVSFNGCTSSSNHQDGWQLNGPGAGIWTLTGCRSNGDGITSGAGITIQGSFAGTAQLTGVATVPATTTPAYGLKISSASGSAQVQVANSTLWGVTGGLSNDGSAGGLAYGGCILASGALGSPAPVWQPVSGQFLCTPASYAPGTQTALTINSLTFAALSSANVNTGSFTAPPSGSVLITVSLIYSQATATTSVAFALAAHGTVSPLVANIWQGTPANTSANAITMMTFLVTGLTPGTSYNFDLLAATGNVSDVLTVTAFGQSPTTITANSAHLGGPVTMTVRAV